ncbi:MAG: lipase family alpha/beta hydrolase [Nanoarchaeota archaeon]
MLNVILGHDIMIDLRVTNDFIEVENNKEEEIEFRVSVNTNPFCRAQCTTVFRDISDNKIIQENSSTIWPLFPVDKKYTVNTEKGTGSKLYRFEIECVSNMTFLCRTTEEPRTRHLTVTVDHELNDEQKEAKEFSRERFSEITKKMKENIGIENAINNATSNLSEYLVFENRTKAIEEINEENIEEIYNLVEIWYNSEYITMSRMVGDIDTMVSESYIELYLELERIRDLVNKQNSIALSLESITNNITEIKDFVILNESLINKISGVVEEINKTIDILHERRSIEDKEHNISLLRNKTIILKEMAIEEHSTNKKEAIKNLNNFWESYCELENCTEPKLINNESDTCHEIEIAWEEYNNTNSTLLPEPYSKCKTIEINAQEIHWNNITIEVEDSNFMMELKENPDMCCMFGECKECCYNTECTKNPIVLIHGHAIDQKTPPDYSMDSLSRLQIKLEDENIANMGRISLYNYFELPENIWGKFRKPVSLKISYYYDIYKEEESSIIIPTKNENLDTYAIRIRDTIDSILYKTNSTKVVIIAHSMGGLVARRYIQIFGESNVEKIMLLGTPNHGTRGIISDLCLIFGEALECRDMRKGSLFLNKLNREPIPDIPFYNVIATGCDMREGNGDGIVLKDSAWLEGADNFIVEGDCLNGKTLHTEFIKDVNNPEFYNIIKEFLET